MDQLSGFWIIGIAVNVILTVLAIVWVLRQTKPRPPPAPAAAKPEDSSHS